MIPVVADILGPAVDACEMQQFAALWFKLPNHTKHRQSPSITSDWLIVNCGNYSNSLATSPS